IESYLLTSAIIGIVSQRLVRRLCPNCRQSYLLDKETALKLGLTAQELKFYKAKGCNMCRHTGYAGRIALHEVLEIGPIMRQVINKGQTSEDLLESTALKSGMLTIKTDGLRKAQAGITSLEELLKVIYLGG
ncbi:MAG: type II/IV secretion system protein, partial [Syntrophomonadaceae bacterium]|nr:type II/IV secretion system protein [Syntrophomonadaceae bacterium]